jgi:hypothetical protein
VPGVGAAPATFSDAADANGDARVVASGDSIRGMLVRLKTMFEDLVGHVAAQRQRQPGSPGTCVVYVCGAGSGVRSTRIREGGDRVFELNCMATRDVADPGTANLIDRHGIGVVVSCSTASFPSRWFSFLSVGGPPPAKFYDLRDNLR